MVSNQPNSRPQKSLSTRLLNWLGLTNETTIKVYHGYGHTEKMTIYGHVLKLSPLPRARYTKSVVNNTLALLRLFVVKPYPHATVEMDWEGTKYTARTDTDGFFLFEWKDKPPLPHGWHEITVNLIQEGSVVSASGKGSIYVPYQTQYGFISDIDDTFLISHSANF